MNKILSVLIIILIFGGGLYYFFTVQKKPDTLMNETAVSETLTQPTRTAEINGYILSAEGNELIIANEIGAKELTDEEKAARQKLTPEERQALRSQESANVTKENVTLVIPVGIPIAKGTGDASGNNVKAEISELVKGIYVSVWKQGDSIEFVKLKGVSQ